MPHSTQYRSFWRRVICKAWWPQLSREKIQRPFQEFQRVSTTSSRPIQAMFCVTCSSMIWYVSNKASPTQQYQTQNWLKVFHNQKRWQLNCNQVERRCTNWKQNDKDSNTTYTTHTFNVPFPRLPRWASTRKVKPIRILLKQEARDSEWQWYQLDCMQVCTLLQTENHASTPPLSFFTGRMPFLQPN